MPRFPAAKQAFQNGSENQATGQGCNATPPYVKPLAAPSVKSTFLPELSEVLAPHRFREVVDAAPEAIPNVELLLKRQTWNTNRAVVLVNLSTPPADFGTYLRQLRTRVASQCGFFPFFWRIGIQVVVVAPGLGQAGITPAQHVARVDNQWAIVQSVFLVDPAARMFRSGRTWGQFETGKFQDAISAVLSPHFQPQNP